MLKTYSNNKKDRKHMFVDKNGIEFRPKVSRCISLMLLGKTAKEIAHELGVSQRTVEVYIDMIKKSLCCSSKSQIISRLMQSPKNRESILIFFKSLAEVYSI
ncbi:MAG: hypothetical protein CNLJKLNK_00955 [Holosporales bacterium]